MRGVENFEVVFDFCSLVCVEVGVVEDGVADC